MEAPRSFTGFISLYSMAFSRGKGSYHPHLEDTLFLQHDVLEAAIQHFNGSNNGKAFGDCLRSAKASRVHGVLARASLSEVPLEGKSAKDVVELLKNDLDLKEWKYDPDCNCTPFLCVGFAFEFVTNPRSTPESDPSNLPPSSCICVDFPPLPSFTNHSYS